MNSALSPPPNEKDEITRKLHVFNDGKTRFMRKIRLKPSAVRRYKKIALQDKERIDTEISSLSEQPHPPGTERIRGVRGGGTYYRIRVGSYRIVYEYCDSFITILLVDDRKDIYKNLKSLNV